MPLVLLASLACVAIIYCTPLNKYLDELDTLFPWPQTLSGHQPSTSLRLEALEGRDCPAGVWDWNGAVFATSNWSNAAGGNWLLNGAAAAAGQYPGMTGSLNEQVRINNLFTGSANLDVPLANPLAGFMIGNAWLSTLTLTAADLQVKDGVFAMNSGTLDLTTHKLEMVNAPMSNWQGGTIMAGAGSKVLVTGSSFYIWNNPDELDTNLEVRQGAGGVFSSVTLGNCTNNLVLNSAANTVTVDDDFSTFAMGSNNQVAGTGGLLRGANHAGAKTAVILVNQGHFQNSAFGAPVVLGGVLENHGGYVRIDPGSQLKIDASNAASVSYIQDGAASLFTVFAGGKLTATGKLEIDQGTLELKVSSGGNSNALECNELIFGNALNTCFMFTDTTAGSPGTVGVIGSVTFGAKTTTTMSYNTTTNTADFLHVQNGVLTLAGTLIVSGNAEPAAGTEFDFFDSFGNNPGIQGAFAKIVDTNGGTPTGAVVNVNAQQKKYHLTW